MGSRYSIPTRPRYSPYRQSLREEGTRGHDLAVRVAQWLPALNEVTRDEIRSLGWQKWPFAIPWRSQAHAYHGNAPRGARRESKAQRLSVVDGRGLIMNGAYGPPLSPTPHKNTTHDDGEYCMVWSTSIATKTALAALTRWEIAKHEMEREAFLHYDLAKPRPEPEINVNFQGQE
ncbi:hypothetical protein E4U44_001070 [Claviceps purpurea]|nr:hypothetical protein E4U44_001070 [Claviceps purpurea]